MEATQVLISGLRDQEVVIYIYIYIYIHTHTLTPHTQWNITDICVCIYIYHTYKRILLSHRSCCCSNMDGVGGHYAK